MPIAEIEQPLIIALDNDLRLRKYDGIHTFALEWYQDEETVKLVDGLQSDIYDEARLERMYHYLNDNGELYFIEVKNDGIFQPVGDVTFSKNDMPIVIGDKRYRGTGIGEKVVSTLIKRAKELGYAQIRVDEIYNHNVASRKLFTKLGFVPYEATQNGHRYELVLY